MLALEKSELPINETNQIQAMFNAVAPRYDFLNRLLSIGYDRHWRKAAVREFDSVENKKYLDVGTGTADIALEIAKKYPKSSQIVGMDFSISMLNLGRKKVSKNRFDKRIQKKSILYVCQPIKKLSRKLNLKDCYKIYNENDSINYFIKNIECIQKKVNKIIIRAHPSENIKKYFWVKDTTSIKVEFSRNNDLLKDINKVGVIVGIDSMAMVLGLIVNKRVISSIPSRSNYCSIPFKNIEFLYNLVKKYHGI